MALRNYKANRKVLISLFKKHNGKCCYCNRITVLPVSGYQGKQPLNLATIEHIYNNYSLIRVIIKKWAKTKLACWECNQKKGREDTNKLFDEYGCDYRITNEGLLISLLTGTELQCKL